MRNARSSSSSLVWLAGLVVVVVLGLVRRLFDLLRRHDQRDWPAAWPTRRAERLRRQLGDRVGASEGVSDLRDLRRLGGGDEARGARSGL